MVYSQLPTALSFIFLYLLNLDFLDLQTSVPMALASYPQLQLKGFGLGQHFSTLVLLTFWVGRFFIVESVLCPEKQHPEPLHGI